MFTYPYPKADSTSSVIAWCKRSLIGSREAIYVVAVRRGKDPFKGMLALPGGFLEIGKETLPVCAQRELEEETHLSAPIDDFALWSVQSSPTRDPRGHVIDHVYSVNLAGFGDARPGDDAAALEFPVFTFDQLVNVDRQWMKEWAFDHGEVLHHFLFRMFTDTD